MTTVLTVVGAFAMACVIGWVLVLAFWLGTALHDILLGKGHQQ